jgi:ABC-type transport system involved in cytochrome bd biosynthesis fused ATPase/permease subunit
VTAAPVDPRLLRHARTSRAGIALLALIGTGQAAVTITIAVALCAIVTTLPGTDPRAIITLAAAFVTRGALAWAEQVAAQRTAARVTDELRRSLLDRVIERGPAWVASYGPGRLTTVLGTGLEALRPWFSGYLPALVLGVVLPPLVIVIMAVVDPASAVVALLTLPLIPLLGALIGWATKARAQQRWAADARLAGHFLDVVQGLSTLRMYGRAERQIHVIADLTDRHRRATMRVLRVAFLSSTALDLVGTLSVGLIAVQAGLRVAAGSMELGPALLVILLAPEAYRPLREMAARYHASTDAGAVIADVDEVLTTGPALPAAPPVPRATGPARPPTPPAPHATGPARPPTPPAPLTTGPARPPTPPAPHTTGPARGGTASGAHTTAACDSTAALTAAGAHGAPTCDPGVVPGVVPGGSRARTGPPCDPPASRTSVFEQQRDSVSELRLADSHPDPDGSLALTGIAAGRWGVRVTGLRARYPGAFEDALRLPELSVRAGELVALKGLSGAGKTTVLRVLAGLHPAEAGAIAVGSVFYLPQRPALPHARTVADAFPPDTAPDDRRAALRTVGLAGEVTGHTPLGEQAAGISAGQRQRLALAVLLHRASRTIADRRQTAAGPVVTLLLDEPTAHLDSLAEHLVIDRLHEFAARGCAVLVVAHRPALLAAADRTVTVLPPTGPVPLPASVTTTVLNALEQSSPATARTQRRITASGTAPGSGRTDPASGQRGNDEPETAPDAGRTDPASRQRGNDEPETAPDAGRTDPASRQRGNDEPETAPDAGRTDPASGRRGGGAAGPWWGRLRKPWVAAGLGAGSSLAGILLTAAAAWLLVRAASLPPVLSLSAAVVLVRGSAVARPLLRYLERLVSHEVAFAQLGRQRAEVYAGLIPHVPGPRLHRRGDLLTKLVDDVDAGTDGLLRGRLPAVAAALTAVTCLGVLVWAAPGAAALVGAGLLISGVLAPAVAGWQVDRQEAATGTARAELRDAMVETVDGVEELGAGNGRPEVPRERSRALARLEAMAARVAGLAAAVAHLGWGVAVAGVAVTLIGTTLPVEWSAVLLLATVVLGETIVGLPEAAIARRRAAAAGHRVNLLTAGPVTAGPVTAGPVTAGPVTAGAATPDSGPTEPNRDDTTGGDRTVPARGATPGGDRAEPGRDGTADGGAGPGRGGAVRVHGLVAGWDVGRVPVLDGLELRLPAGSRTAVTGRSGCGKSTLAAVLAGLLAPRAGTVDVGGRVVLVGDETGHVFASTVRENLLLASPSATDAQLEDALARVGLGGMRLDTWLGTGGGTISGGQRRRLATARALLADPALLILDEPTEGIDEAGARELMADLLDAASGRTVLVFAHRREGLDLVDRTFELGPEGLREKSGEDEETAHGLRERPGRHEPDAKNVRLDRSVL